MMDIVWLGVFFLPTLVYFVGFCFVWRERRNVARRQQMDVCDTPRLKALRQRYMDDPNYESWEFEADVEKSLADAADDIQPRSPSAQLRELDIEPGGFIAEDDNNLYAKLAEMRMETEKALHRFEENQRRREAYKKIVEGVPGVRAF